jgi:5-methylcytosine-specific restriction endonuclease McrA
LGLAHLTGKRDTLKLGKAKIKFHKRSGRRCWYCGNPVAFDRRAKTAKERFATVDHQMPLSRGGYDKRDNKVTACISCNQEKADRTVDEYRVLLMTMRQEGYVAFYGEIK